MSENSVKQLLTNHGLRQTDCRRDVLSIFTAHGQALSHNDIEEQIVKNYDRVTIYRTLNSFIEQGLIHKVLDDSGTAKYALCLHDHAEQEKHSDEHIHFKCNQCGKTKCLDEVAIPEIKLPKGYIKQELNFLVLGICKACNTTK